MNLSAKNRSKLLQACKKETFDLIIIGGGITGAGIALDASLRGLKCALFEMQDFSAGTSSRSTKLIHGGLRYLKQLEIGLVREVGLERAIVHRNARHVVRAEKMLLPIIKNGSLGKFTSSIALSVYDFLADVEKVERRKMLSKHQTQKAEPLLNKENLLGGGLYYEYRSDDARLTIEVLKSATKHGAKCFSYTKVEDFTYSNETDTINGIVVNDLINQQKITINAKTVVNAAGPWVDKLRGIDGTVMGKRLQLTKGVHLVIEKETLPVKQACYFDVGDGRMIFAIPRNKVVYIGTTDTTYTAQIARPKISEADVLYILAAANKMFPTANLQVTDIISTWAGLRPLIHEDGKSPSELSRKDEIFISDSGLISIAGGKLTGYRKMAERTVDEVVKELEKTESNSFKQCATENELLSGGKFKDEAEFKALIQKITKQIASIDLTEADAANLVGKYGSNSPKIITILTGLSHDYNHYSSNLKLLVAELIYGVEHEMVLTLSDFIVRRTGRLYFERPEIIEYVEVLNSELATLLSLTAEQKNQSYTEFITEYNEVLEFHKEPIDLVEKELVA
ncbi:UNVERIFIED_CONTAM: hypothetical protein GTU68_062691 [Idotea baltica]|nr:hypothetical protein [Idotea baltica]